MTQRTVRAPMASTVVEVLVATGDAVHAGQPLLIVEAMKMEHELRAEADGRVEAVLAEVGESVEADDVLLRLAPMRHESPRAGRPGDGAGAAASAALRPDLQELRDAPRRDARRRASRGRGASAAPPASAPRARTSPTCATRAAFVEYGALAIAAQRSRRSLEDLIRQHAGRRHGDRHRPRQRRAVSAPRRRAAS